MLAIKILSKDKNDVDLKPSLEENKVADWNKPARW
jgi:hypothetical protein